MNQNSDNLDILCLMLYYSTLQVHHFIVDIALHFFIVMKHVHMKDSGCTENARSPFTNKIT